ncbi:MAG TPA: O-antigen ligase family protein [Bacteroidota bacterium]|nr:O-antigen ligase family protein [Bacteroidota bacterium]
MDELPKETHQNRDRYDQIIFALLVVFLLCTSFSIALSEIGYFSALSLLIIKRIVSRNFSYPRTPVDYFLLGYVFAEVMATIFAIDKTYSLLYLQRRILLLPIVYILIDNITSLKDLKVLFGALILSAVGVSVWSLVDIVFYFREYLLFERRLSEFQIYMTAGGIMMIAVLLILPFVVHKQTPKKIRIAALLITVPLIINLLFTFTRSSWLGFLAGVVVMGGLRYRKLIAPVIAVVLLIIFLSTPEMKERMLSIVDPSHPANVSRLHMWKTGINIFKAYPLFGIGDVGIEIIWDKYAEPGWDPEGHLHNNFIMWMVTLGAVGTVALVALFLSVWIVFYNIEKKFRDDWFINSMALGGLSVIVGFHVNGLFEWNFGDAEIITIIWAIIGLILAAEKLSYRVSG